MADPRSPAPEAPARDVDGLARVWSKLLGRSMQLRGIEEDRAITLASIRAAPYAALTRRPDGSLDARLEPDDGAPLASADRVAPPVSPGTAETTDPYLLDLLATLCRASRAWGEAKATNDHQRQGMAFSAEADATEAVESAFAALGAERDEARKIAAEGRKAGRAEAAEILLHQEAESFPETDGDDALVESYEIGDTGDWGTSWIREKVLDLFDARDSEMTSALERYEGAYWERCGKEDEAIERAKRAERERNAALARAESSAREVDRLREALRTMVKAGQDVLVDDYQDRIEDPVGHHERQPYHRIHTKALEDLVAALASARAALAAPSPTNDSGRDPDHKERP